MAKKLIRLTESDLRRVVKESVKKILKEYEWNGRTPEQDAAAIKAANTPTSWKQHMLRSQIASTGDKPADYHRSMNALHKGQQAFANKYLGRNGSDVHDYVPGHHANTIRGNLTDVYPTSGRLAYNQEYMPTNAERYTEKNYGDSKGYNVPKEIKATPENGSTTTNFFGDAYKHWGKTGDITKSLSSVGKEGSETVHSRDLPSSPRFKQQVNDMDNDMTDFYSGNYAERLQNKKQQLGNKGKY